MARTRGAVSRRTVTVREMARNIGVDPLEILLMVAKMDWKGLGYESPTKTQYTPDGTPYEVERIQLQDRVMAAKDACKYIYPTRKPVDDQGNSDEKIVHEVIYNAVLGPVLNSDEG